MNVQPFVMPPYVGMTPTQIPPTPFIARSPMMGGAFYAPYYGAAMPSPAIPPGYLNLAQPAAAMPFEGAMRGAVQKIVKAVSIKAIPKFENPLEKGVLRLIGFCNEFAEAVEHLIPKPIYRLLYGVEAIYTAVDGWNTRQHAMKHQDGGLSPELKKSVGTSEVVNTLIKQGLATFLIPTLAIKEVKKYTLKAIQNPKLMKALPKVAATWLTSAKGKNYAPMITGLLTIIPLTKIVDPLVFNSCDKMIRPVIGAAPLASGE